LEWSFSCRRIFADEGRNGVSARIAFLVCEWVDSRRIWFCWIKFKWLCAHGDCRSNLLWSHWCIANCTHHWCSVRWCIWDVESTGRVFLASCTCDWYGDVCRSTSAVYRAKQRSPKRCARVRVASVGAATVRSGGVGFKWCKANTTSRNCSAICRSGICLRSNVSCDCGLDGNRVDYRWTYCTSKCASSLCSWTGSRGFDRWCTGAERTVG